MKKYKVTTYLKSGKIVCSNIDDPEKYRIWENVKDGSMWLLWSNDGSPYYIVPVREVEYIEIKAIE